MIHRLGPRLSVARFRSGFLATLIPVLTTLTAKAEVLISATLITEYDLAYFQNLGFNAATNGVQVLKLTYNTVGIDGMPTIATAAYVDPITTCATPLVCYFHGTVYQKDLAPSNWQDTSGVGFVGYYFGSTGMACVFPDFLGLGDSSGPHPYLHASTEASASIDAVRAAREYRMQQGNPLHEQLFLFGASAGSHACLATAQVMQTSFPDEFNITAAGNVSGPYALYPVFRDQLISMQPYGAGANLLYALFSYSVMYPGLFPTPSSFLVPPFSFILRSSSWSSSSRLRCACLTRSASRRASNSSAVGSLSKDSVGPVAALAGSPRLLLSFMARPSSFAESALPSASS